MSRLTAFLTNSFGDPNAHPPTPKKTPTSATFPSPVFATPQQDQGHFNESGSWTPQFAEDYSVFNDTPGNLKGGQAQFSGFVPFTPTSQVGGHKRLLSSDSATTDIQPHAQYSPNLSAPFQQTASLAIPALGQTQTETPPPSSNKEGRKLAPKLKMNQDGQEYPQPDFSGAQSNDLSGFLGSPGDLFSYPMSAPVTGPENNFWDPASLDMSMDMDFSTTDMFDPNSAPISNSNHRHSTSFDWNSEVHLFQSPPQPTPNPPPTKQQQKAKPPPKKARALAPKPPVMEQNVSMTSAPPQPTLMSNMSIDGSFPAAGPGDVVNPGILFSQQQTHNAARNFDIMGDVGQTELITVPSNGVSDSSFRRSMSVKDLRNGKLPDRASASSPVKPSARPGLSRSQSENRGRKSIGRTTVVNQSTRPTAPVRNPSGVDANRLPRSGRVSPLKRQGCLSSLASIPESANRPGSRASVNFFIGADGRAHAEAAHMGDRRGSRAGSRSRSSNGQPEEDDSESSSDDEPIIIPSRNASFNTSFALPDPRKPVGSIFHPARRSISDKSTSTLTVSDSAGLMNDAASEAETVMNEAEQEGGNAANELLRVRENRQTLSGSFSGLKSQRLFGLPGNAHGSSISPTRTDSGNTTDEPGVRCVCHKNDFTGFLVQW
jgi:hypothetical protein